MMNLRTFVAVSATVMAVAVATSVFAQDDLDDLLADLEADTKAEAAKPAEEAKAAEPAVEPAAEIEVKPVALPEKAEEPEEKAEEPAAPAAVAESEKAQEPAEVAEVKEEPVAAAPEVAEAKEEPVEAAAAPAVAEAAPAPAAKSEEKVDEVLSLLDDLADESKASAEPVAAAQSVQAAPATKVTSVSKTLNPEDRELIEYVRNTEELRRKALDAQAMREIEEARKCMLGEEFAEATRHYGIASKLLNDRTDSKDLKRECAQGIAEGLYRAALEEERTGRRERAIKLIEKAVDMRHPMARRQLEKWLTADDPDKNKTDVSEITHRRNEEDYKARRLVEQKRLKRARHYLSQREIDRALEECELVLVGDPYNQEAIRLRDRIQQKRQSILQKEREVARKGWIADVDEAWRPVYAPDARELQEKGKETVKKDPNVDPELSIEQSIIKRMKEMRLPAISFKPPATIIDAVEYFRGASRDFDRPEIPIEQRGFNFVLKTPEALRAKVAEAAADNEEGFADTGSDETAGNELGVPVIPMITASDITFYDALKLVCESVNYKFSVQGPIVMVMQRDMTTAELVTRSFPVLSTFLEKMGGASEDMKEMKSSGFGGGAARNNDSEEENQERDWKQFFELLGVKWPEGSSIFYVKTVGRLFVKNTLENLAEFENVLLSLNQQVTLVEIETRFVEVCQDDLNSLGFEWILNNDYSVGLNKHVGKALGIRGGGWNGAGVSTSGGNTTSSSSGMGIGGGGNTTGVTGGGTSGSLDGGTLGGGWVKQSGNRNIGLNKFGGDSGYGTNNRYLSTMSNHIDGEGYSTNDQFVRMNAFLGNADLSMILHMLSQRSDTDLLSAPKVITRPGEEAVMKVVTEYIYPTDYDVQLQSSSSGGGGNNGGSSQSAILAVVEPQSFTMREVGVILTVTPTLTDDGNVVDLELNTQVVDEPTWKNYGMRIPFTGNSSLQNFQGLGEIFTGLSQIFTTLGTAIKPETKEELADTAMNSASAALENLTNSDGMTYYDAPMEQPFFHVRSIDSKVSVYPGATIVMGGLITEQRRAMDDKVPYLGDIPFLGRFFRSHSELTSKRNLLIFVTTRIIDGRGREMRNDGFQLAEQKEGEVKGAPEASEK
jgi:general secretion pathway protein D